MKTIDEREMQKAIKEKQTKTERNKGNRSYSERVTAKLFCCVFKLGFLELVCKACLIFKWNIFLFLSGGVLICKASLIFNSKKPNLNAQQNHLISNFCSRCSSLPLFVSLLLFFAFLYHH